ncbi:MAG: EAL domain-containing protein [Gammaproteobacteria bacterium]|nr:EAL domain-containing protein [Gammaproteobacteria bacterium]
MVPKVLVGSSTIKNLLPFKRIADNLNSGLIILDDRARIVYFNSWVSEAGDISGDSAFGEHVLSIFGSIEKTRVWECVTDSLIFGLSGYISSAFIDSPFDFFQNGFNGLEYYRINQAISIKPLQLSDDVFGCEIQIQDVTEFKRREKELKKASVKLNATAQELSHERDNMSAILESSKSAIMAFRNNGSISLANKAVKDVFGYEQDEIKRLLFSDIFLKKGAAGVSKNTAMFFEGFTQGVDSCPVLTAYKKDGSAFKVELQIGNVSDKIDSERMVIARDVTERLRLERTLKNSESRFKALTSIAPVGIFYTNMHGQFKYVNGMWTMLTGFSLDQMAKKHWHEVVYSKDSEIVMAKWLQSQADGTPFASEFRIKAGYKIIWVLCQVMEERDIDNNVVGFVGTITDVTSQKESRNQIEMLAFYDPLTTLANRRLFRDRMEHAIFSAKRTGGKLALLNLDLDHFKRVNDTLGHDVGDLLLTNIASRLKECVRRDDTVARLGGDEFAILLVNIESPSVAALIAEKVIGVVRKPVVLPEQQVNMTVTIGISIFPDDATNVSGFVKNADMAMYSAKSLGRNRFSFFTEEMNEKVVNRFVMERDLRTAFDNDQFFLVYQPQYAVDTQRFIGMEALIRWQCPSRGLVPPDVFIQVAEQSGQIIEIGDWVLEKSCKDMKALLDKGIIDPDSRICVNLSAKQFLEPRLPFVVHRALMQSGLLAKNLELEITESMLMENLGVALSLVRCLKGFGVYIAIDDFGTGYSSLGYLKQLPVDTLKIDKCFIDDLVDDDQDKGIVTAVIALAHNLSLSVIAEGIEFEEQLEFLRENDCDYAQGYLLSKPLMLDAVVESIYQNLNEQERFKGEGI